MAWSGHLWNALDPPLDLRYEGVPLGHVRLFPNGDRYLALGPGGVAVIGDAVSGALLQLLEHGGAIEDAWVFPAGDHVVTRAHSYVVVWDVAAGRPHATLSGHTAWVSDVAVFPDGRRLVTGGYDGRALIWDVASGSLLSELVLAPRPGRPRAPRLSPRVLVQVFPAGDRVLTCGGPAGGAHIWNATSGQLLRELFPNEQMPRRAHFCAISGSGDRVATAERTGLYIWDAASGRRLHYWSMYFIGGVDRARGVRFFPSDDRLLVMGAYDSAIWDLRGASSEFVGLSSMQSATISADGSLVVGCGGRRASVYEASSGRPLRTLQGSGGARPGKCSIDMGRDLRSIVGWGNPVELWAAEA